MDGSPQRVERADSDLSPGASERDEPRPADVAERRKTPFWKELPVLIVLAFAIALLIKTFALQAFFIPSESMAPTLLVGDRVLVEKLSYRFGEPSRGDVVVFERDLGEAVGEEPGSFVDDVTRSIKELFGFPTGGEQDFIKRVIAVEGDRVEGRDGAVLVNGEPIDEPYLPARANTSEFDEITVGEDEIFVMGDNRQNSDDSRNFGPIPADTVIGHAFLLLWPPEDFRTL